MRIFGSNFTTRTGLVVIAVLILAAAYFRLAALAVFLGALGLLCLLAFLWARVSLRKIEVKFDAEELCAFPGESPELSARLANRKFLPLLWLELDIPLRGQGCIAPPEGEMEEAEARETDEMPALREHFAWIMPQQTLVWRQRGRAMHRGVCPIESVTLRSGDGFGLSEQTLQLRLPRKFRFVVYPRIFPVDAAPMLHNMSELEQAKNGFYEDKTLLRTTRDYRAGDSFKDINWRLLARTGAVQVNVRERLAMRRVCFLPDLESFCETVQETHDEEKLSVRRVRKEALERMFSLMASLVVALQEHEILCTLVVPAIGECAGQIRIPESAEGQVMELLTAMAEIDYDAQETHIPLDELLEARHKLGRIYIFSHDLRHAVGAADEDFAAQLGALRVVQNAADERELPWGTLKESDLITI